MLALSLDSSSSNISFSLFKGDMVLLKAYKNTQEKTLNLLPKLFNAFDINPKDIDIFFLSIGIGYATPLKIGINFIKAMAISLDKPIVIYTNIDAVAKTYFKDEDIFLYKKVSDSYVGAFYEKGIRISEIEEVHELPHYSKYIEEYEHMFSEIGYLTFKSEKPTSTYLIEPLYTRAPTRAPLKASYDFR